MCDIAGCLAKEMWRWLAIAEVYVKKKRGRKWAVEVDCHVYTMRTDELLARDTTRYLSVHERNNLRNIKQQIFSNGTQRS